MATVSEIEETRILHPEVSPSGILFIFQSIVYKPNDLFGDNVLEGIPINFPPEFAIPFQKRDSNF